MFAIQQSKPRPCMRNRYPHRENVESILACLAICLQIMTMQHIRESPSASYAMRKSAWNAHSPYLPYGKYLVDLLVTPFSLPPASAVDVIETVLSVCVWVGGIVEVMSYTTSHKIVVEECGQLFHIPKISFVNRHFGMVSVPDPLPGYSLDH